MVFTHSLTHSLTHSFIHSFKVHQIYYEKSGRDDHALGHAVSAASVDVLVKCPEDLKRSNAPCAHALFNELEKDPEAVVKGIYT